MNDTALRVPAERRSQLSQLDLLAAIPEEEVWLETQKSARSNQKKPLDPAGRMDPDAIDRVMRKYARKVGLVRGYSAPSMRRPSSPRHWRTAHSSKTCRRRPDTATHPQRSFMTGGTIILKKPTASLPRTESMPEPVTATTGALTNIAGALKDWPLWLFVAIALTLSVFWAVPEFRGLVPSSATNTVLFGRK